MAKKISQLTQATQVKSDDVTVIVQDGETKKLPLNTLVTKQDIENKKVAGLAKLDEIEATYENDTYTPTITVKNKSSVKTGEGDEVDYSANVMDGHAKSAILKGQTLVNLADYDSYEYVNYDCLISLKHKATSNIYTIFNYSDKVLQILDENGGLLAQPKANSVNLLNNNTLFKIRGTSGYGWQNNGEFQKSFIVLEGDYRNQDIPYFEGMQSVKMPVLTTSNEDGTKTNILTVNEDIELRGIGNVQDTLDCSTGEVTERIGEIVLDGSGDESWALQSINTENIANFRLTIPFKTNGQTLCDKFIKQSTVIAETTSPGYLMQNTNTLYIRVLSTTANNVESFRNYLASNPVTIQYEITTPVIKTVDLMPSGTHPSTTPYCWKNGHIQLSSSGLLPNLEYSVVTSRAGQINQNATMIVKNDKRIFDLEILLAGGLVNTTYQALTLQNQVETGLSKVSLNSETEPDYLLYHMIMKLIEEKAYKLDDLTEKVSVFYLYEKLSDEQFETIYSALYPFVEDEIVEEPVVEELPEVVEDEVIM